MRTIALGDASGPAEARRQAVGVARRLGFDEEDTGRVALMVTELATNVIRHVGDGEMLLDEFEDADGAGVTCIALDRGPGIGDVDAAERDGYSTGGTSGTGLGALRRNAHFMDIYSRPGAGTAVLIQSRPGRIPPESRPHQPGIGAVALPKSGEPVSGDSWAWLPTLRGLRLMVADGLGHGAGASEASQAAVAAFRENAAMTPGDLLGVMHARLKPTRGAAVAIADVRLDTSSIRYAGIGNIAGAIVCAGVTRQMVSMHGTVGHVSKRVQPFSYAFERDALVVLSSDGLATNWSTSPYPTLDRHHPMLVAAVLYRDFARGRDDVTVVAARLSP